VPVSHSNCILALDQGTTSSRAILYNDKLESIAVAQQEFAQIFPQPGWVEHDAEEIWVKQLQVAREVLQQTGIGAAELAGIGITNQRETTVVWDRQTGKPIYNAIVWQDRRTSDFCQSLRDRALEPAIVAKTGLLIDAYFSATKIHWILEHVAAARERAAAGQLAFGTIDSWLIWNLTGGSAHITDVSNASRTQLYNINTLQWDQELLELFGVPASLLPTVVDSSGALAVTAPEVLGKAVAITGIAGDQQAALFGQMCFQPGMTKCTYGTGCFLTMNTGEAPVYSKHRLLTSIAWKIGEQVHYALEGGVFMGGATIQWLRDGLQFLEDATESEALATSVDSCEGVVMVPALTGLGAPYWDENARGLIIGMTRGTTRAHITRAALESICYQVNDVIVTMEKDRDGKLGELRIDGGATANNFMVQFQSDISGVDVVRPENIETTALGAACLAGLAVGLWSREYLSGQWQIDRKFTPQMDSRTVATHIDNWQRAVERAMHWAN
jgi:glycerol kinase